MIKANNKNALGAYFRNVKIQAAYFRGQKIWEHEHTWNNNTCVGCGVLRLAETSNVITNFWVAGNANITFLDADNNKKIYDKTDGTLKVFNVSTNAIYISSGAENITEIRFVQEDSVANNFYLNGSCLPALNRISLTDFIVDSLTVSGTSALTELSIAKGDLKLLDISNCTGLVTQDLLYLDCNNLKIIGGANLQSLIMHFCTVNGTIDLSDCPNVKTLNCFNRNLTSNAVNAILAALVANGVTNGTADLRNNSDGECNTPTGQGLTDRQTLINRGWTIKTKDS